MCSTIRHHLQAAAKAVALFALVYITNGCSDPTPPPATASTAGCRSDTDCQGKGGFCVNGSCQQCKAHLDCKNDQVCKEGRCDAQPACTCTAGQDCVHGECVAMAPKGACEGGDCQDVNANVTMPAACRVLADGKVDLNTIAFDFDAANLTPEARAALDQHAECLNALQGTPVVLEGHCDERGTEEYNLALGAARAEAVDKYLKALGVDTARLRTVSKGKNEPVCRQSDEACWAKNRRVELDIVD
jgi:peptidoglycan-associated lipoprotein